jgi:hypothetical protein
VSNRTGDGVVDDHHAMTAVTVVASWTQLARPLAHLVLVEAAGAQYGGSGALGAVMSNSALVRCRGSFTHGAVVTGGAVARGQRHVVVTAVLATSARQAVRGLWNDREKDCQVFKHYFEDFVLGFSQSISFSI